MNIFPGKSLRSLKRRRKLDQIVIHESVTWSTNATVKVLERRKLSTHYCVDVDSRITRHVSDGRKALHAGAAHNNRSIGIDVVNRYYGEHAKDDQLVITAPWAHKKSYIVPPITQLEALYVLIVELTTRHSIPLTWPCIVKGKWKFGRRSPLVNRKPGIVAHSQWAHADGAFPSLYCCLRANGMDMVKAFTTALTMASERSPKMPEFCNV